jgi:ATP adenylyltransferase
VNHDRIWAPWRLDYVSGSAPRAAADQGPQPAAWHGGADHDCFLCRAAATYDDAQAERRLLVVARGAQTLVLLNRYPYNNGHMLVAPLRHVGELAELTGDEHVESMQWLSRLTRVFREQLKADGFNVGLNLGRSAGAGLVGHLHWHLVPRWSGDNNFMPVLAGVRVIPQSLDSLWEMLAGTLGQ